jgi:hypothetical protein
LCFQIFCSCFVALWLKSSPTLRTVLEVWTECLREKSLLARARTRTRTCLSLSSLSYQFHLIAGFRECNIKDYNKRSSWIQTRVPDLLLLLLED